MFGSPIGSAETDKTPPRFYEGVVEDDDDALLALRLRNAAVAAAASAPRTTAAGLGRALSGRVRLLGYGAGGRACGPAGGRAGGRAGAVGLGPRSVGRAGGRAGAVGRVGSPIGSVETKKNRRGPALPPAESCVEFAWSFVVVSELVGPGRGLACSGLIWFDVLFRVPYTNTPCLGPRSGRPKQIKHRRGSTRVPSRTVRGCSFSGSRTPIHHVWVPEPRRPWRIT